MLISGNINGMKKILTIGVYDLLHIGHIELFRKAKSLGDFLIVAVQNSEYVAKYKPNTNLFYSTEERVYIVSAIKYVDKVVVYTSADEIVKAVDFDILAVGPDQTNSAFVKAKQWCAENGKQVVMLPRTEGISSSQIRSILNSD